MDIRPKTKRIFLTLLAVTLLAPSLVVAQRAPAPSPTPSFNPEACKEREAAIRDRSRQLAERAEQAREKIGQINDRVIEYNEQKAFPAGARVANFAALRADIEKKDEASKNNLEKLKGIEEFSCGADQPKATLVAHKAATTATYRSLREYRSAVRNLLVTVRTADSFARRPTPTPESTEKPRGIL